MTTQIDPKTARLRAICEAEHLTPDDICELTGRGKSVVYHWMSGKHKQIPSDMLELLALKIEKRKADNKEG